LKKKATIVDIAAKVGVTPSAVSKAFSGHPRISAETKRKVLKAAEELGYKPNIMASGLRNGKSRLVGVIVPGVHYSFFSSAIKGIEELMTSNGYNVIIVQTRDSQELEQKQIEGLMKAQVDGIIASIAMETKDYSAFLNISKHIPVVLFDRTFRHETLSEVTINDFKGAFLAVNHLLQEGYKRIAHLAGSSHVKPFHQRIQGYKAALSAAGISSRENYIIECAADSESGEMATKKLLALNEPPDAIFAASDYLAYGAMQAVSKKGLSIPGDIGIVGFSNEAFTQQVSPTITTVDQHSETLGASAAQILLKHLDTTSKDTPIVVQRKIIEPNLIVRQSSKRKNINP